MCDRLQMGTARAGGTGKDNSVPCYTLKIRGGCSTYMKQDGKVGTAGKGPLIQEEKSATLGVTQDQYLFVPDMCLNDQGGAQMNVSYGKTETLRAQAHGHQPIVLENDNGEV